MKVLVYGSINIDMNYHVDHIVLPGETISALKFEKSAGGKGANQAAALAKAGLEVYMAGKAGRDGDFLLELLRSYGVNTGHVAVYEGPTGHAIIQLDKNKQNSIFLFSGGNGEITLEEIDSTLESFGKGDLIVLQNEIVHLGEIIGAAAEREMVICLNPSPYNPDIETLPLERVNVFFVNEIEGAAMAGLPACRDFQAILERLAARFPAAEFILTAGPEGAFYARGKERAGAPIVESPVLDTVGAGDTFSGYFIAARSRGYTPQEALDLAARAASIAVSRPGAMASVPRADEVF
ncbi:MAG: ribokinase [Treponema sp.]|jgi:ribokinase|nr:ribokinase [Treponema sp.]